MRGRVGSIARSASGCACATTVPKVAANDGKVLKIRSTRARGYSMLVNQYNPMQWGKLWGLREGLLPDCPEVRGADLRVPTDHRHVVAKPRSSDYPIWQVRHLLAWNTEHHLHNSGVYRHFRQNLFRVAHHFQSAGQSACRHTLHLSEVDDFGQADR